MAGPAGTPSWRETRERAHADYLDWSETPNKLPGAFQYGEVMAGCVTGCRRCRHLQRRRQLPDLDSPLLSVPRLWRASWRRPAARWAMACPRRSWRNVMIPDRIAGRFAGDGDFLMNGQEFATAVQYDCPVIIIVLDNGMYGTIRMHQEREFPGRVVATELRIRISRPGPGLRRFRRTGGADRGVRPRLRAGARLQQAGHPALRGRPQALTPAMTLDGIRDRARGETS